METPQSKALDKKSGVNKKTFIKNAIENWHVLGKTGVPSKLASSLLNKGNFSKFISKEDHKYSHKDMKNQKGGSMKAIEF